MWSNGIHLPGSYPGVDAISGWSLHAASCPCSERFFSPDTLVSPLGPFPNKLILMSSYATD